jgi:nicotinamide N-methyltransferase
MLNELFDQFQEAEEPEPEFPIVEWNGISVRLLNRHHSLWGDQLAEAGKIAAKIVSDQLYGVNVSNLTVVELGAGCGLPSICCCLQEAKVVVATDYPDDPLIDNLRHNLAKFSNAKAIGHLWGKNFDRVLDLNAGEKFDVLILSDLIFNHAAHRHLLMSVQAMMSQTGYALVLFTHHRTHLVREDLAFFEMARDEFRFVWDEVGMVKHPPMFVDSGDIALRTTAHIAFLRFPSYSIDVSC